MVLKICKHCGLKIRKKDKGVTWITFENEIDLETIHWHWKCFLEWRNSSLENRATKIYQETVEKMVPSLKGIISELNTSGSQEKVYTVK